MATAPTPMALYQAALERYYISVETTVGCARYADDVKREYLKAKACWEQLSAKEKEDHPMPRLTLPTDDGTGGLASGLATFAANSNRNHGDCSIS